MQSTVASLLLITSAAILTCVVVNYAVAVVGETIHKPNADGFDALNGLQTFIRNQTSIMSNQTQESPPNECPP
jgi:hypothetical protein